MLTHIPMQYNVSTSCMVNISRYRENNISYMFSILPILAKTEKKELITEKEMHHVSSLKH